MSETLDLSCSVLPRIVADRYLSDRQVGPGRSEDQVEIAKGITFSDILPVPGNDQIVSSQERFRPAQRVLDPHARKRGKGQTEEFVPDHIEKPHGILLRPLHQTAADHELADPRYHGIVELREVLRPDGEISVRMIRTSPVACSNPVRTASPLTSPGCVRTLMSRSGYAADTRLISSSVPSCECPSTKMISLCRPRAGMRRTAASMFPRSFHAGTITEQVSSCAAGVWGGDRSTTEPIRAIRQSTGSRER